MQPLPQRRHPVHKLPVERAYVPTVLFVTLAIRPRVAAFDNHSFLSVFQLAVADADAWRTVSFVLMPDHIHMFVVPNRYPPVGIKTWSEYLKRRITIQFGPHPDWDWLPGCWDTQMRDRAGYEEKLSYVRLNPVRAGLAADAESWPWRGSGEDVVWG